MDTLAREHYIEQTMTQNTHNRGQISPLQKWKPVRNTILDSDENKSSGFDCNICLDSVQDPVVTLCGHLYCWPCIYKWLHFQTDSPENEEEEEQKQQCPVCKAEVSEGTLVPLFGKGQTTKHPPSKGKSPNLGIIIPRRPLGLACGFDSSPRTSSPFSTSSSRPYSTRSYSYSPQRSSSPLYYSQPGSNAASPMLTSNMFDPVMGMFGEMIYARVFGNSVTNIYSYPDTYNLAGNTSPRLRRHVMQADKSLSRICFFLFCCVFLCFLSF